MAPTPLQHMQRALAQLVRTGVQHEPPADGATARYLQTVAQAPGLSVMREVVRDWRYLLLRQGCPLTSGALVGEGSFAAVVAHFMAGESLDPLTQNFAMQFLAWVVNHRTDDIASVAQFEQALINLRRGLRSAPVTVYWHCHPMEALAAALHAHPMPLRQPCAIYETETAAHLIGDFVISEIPAATALPAAAR